MLKKSVIRFLSLSLALVPALAHAGSSLPSAFDWREQLHGLSPVRSQEQCGSCWAFATITAMETQVKMKTGQTVSLSPQHLISCNHEGWGCNGGFFPLEFAVKEGFVLERDFPYTAHDESCKPGLSAAFHATSYTQVAPKGSPTTEALKQAIYDHGLVMTTMYVGSKFSSYQGGIFASCEANPVNTAVNLVGWNDADGYWIARNAWGAKWGEQGYFRIAYGCNQIGSDAYYLEYNP